MVPFGFSGGERISPASLERKEVIKFSYNRKILFEPMRYRKKEEVTLNKLMLHKATACKLLVGFSAISMLLFSAGCRDSSIDEAYEAAMQTTAASEVSSGSATPASTANDEVSGPQSIADSTTETVLSEITLSKDLTGTISIDGSAMMSSISDKLAEQFRKACPKMSITTGLSGTEEGIAKFLSQKLDICNTSRALNDSETADAKAKGIDYAVFKVAYDGIVIAVDKSNPVDTITVDEIKAIWEPDSAVMGWKEVNSNWPDNSLMVFGPKADTGLIEFFSTNILEATDGQIGIYTETASDKEFVKSIAGDTSAIGLTGFSNYFNAKSSIKALKVDFGSGPVTPDVDSIESGKYQQLSSPMYLYVAKTSLQKIETKAFVKYYLENAAKIVKEAGYVPLSEEDYQAQMSEIG